MVKNFSLTIASFLLTCLLSCDNSADEKKSSKNTDSMTNARSMNDNGLPADSLERRILEFGDTNAYDYLRMELVLESPVEITMKWSKIMVDKYPYPAACIDYFYSVISKCDPDGLECLTKNEKDTAILILNKAVAKGDSVAIKLKNEYIK